MPIHFRLALLLPTVFVACLELADCKENHAMAADAKTITVTEKDSGAKIKSAKGDTLVVRLDVQSGTAFGWKLVKNDDNVLKAPAKPEIERPEKPKPGGKVTHVFRFTTEAAGPSDLEMHYVRPFDKDKAPAKTFKLSVTVE